MEAAKGKAYSYLPGILLAACFAILAVRSESFTIPLTLGVIAISLGILLSLGSSSPVLRLLFLLLPVSMEIPAGIGDSKIIFPSELLVLLLCIAFGTRICFQAVSGRAFIRHPLTIIVLLYLAAMAAGSFTSSILLVSLKYTLVNTAYILVFYFMVYEYITGRIDRAVSLLILYAIPLLIIIIYALVRHAELGFGRDSSGIVVQPFYSDHSIYSACIAMVLPFFVALTMRPRQFGISSSSWIFIILSLLILVTGLFLSYSRAAWMSLVAGGIFYFVLLLRIRAAHIALILAVAFAAAFIEQDYLVHTLRQNQNNSSKPDPTLTEQTMSVTNISTDVSNAERLNRWSCAYRMFLDKPLSGYGPGTYQFAYLPYQRPEEMTRISVTSAYNNVFGQGGSAHNEYLLALSEMGLPGFLLFTGIAIGSIFIGMRAFYNAPDDRSRYLTAAVFVGLITYLFHSFFNNFLNNDKAAGLFWACIALLVALDQNRVKPAAVKV